MMSHPRFISPRYGGARWLQRPGSAVAFLAVLLFTDTGAGHAQMQIGDTSLPPVSDPRYATEIVARVGPIEISAQQFLLSYEFGPAFAKREKHSRHTYLEYMINEKLLALDAADRGAKSSAQVRRSVGEIEGDLVTEELYRDDILSKVSVTGGELTKALREQRTHYSLRWLHAPTREEIDSLRDALAGGVTFDRLFRAQPGDSAGPGLRSMDITLFQLRNERPAIAAAVQSLNPGAISAPVEGPDGWYIMNVGSVTFDAIATSSNVLQMRYDAQRAITRRKADSLSVDYVNQLMSGHSPVIEPKTFALLSTYLAQIWVPADRRESWNVGRSLDRELQLAAVKDIDRFGDETLVHMKDRSVRLARFLSWYRARDQIVKLRTTSLLSFESSLEGLVWRMVRDGLLIERATQRGMQHRATVKTQRGWWEEKVLYAAEKKALGDSITLDESRLKKYYEDHPRDYRNSAGDLLPLESVRDRVRKDCWSAELTARILHRLIALKRRYPVSIDEKVLAGLPVDSREDARAIDVYTAKTGGTFPHPAFPTIDYDWEGWQ